MIVMLPVADGIGIEIVEILRMEIIKEKLKILVLVNSPRGAH